MNLKKLTNDEIRELLIANTVAAHTDPSRALECLKLARRIDRELRRRLDIYLQNVSVDLADARRRTSS